MERQQGPGRVRGERASTGGPPAFSLDWGRTGAREPGLPRRGRFGPPEGVGCSPRSPAWGTESLKPCTVPPTQTTQRGGGNSFISLSCCTAPTALRRAGAGGIGAAVPVSSGWQQRGSGGWRLAGSRCSAQSRTWGAPLEDSGREAGTGVSECPCAECVCPSPRLQQQTTRAFPQPVLALPAAP